MRTYALVKKNRLPALSVISDDEAVQYVGNSSDAFAIFSEIDDDTLIEEHFFLITMNTRNRVLGFFDVAHGGIDNCYIDAYSVFIRAVLCGSKRIIVGHNHPSGSVSPSSSDFEMTAILHDAGKTLGVQLIDHIIFSDDKYFSMADEGQLSKSS